MAVNSISSVFPINQIICISDFRSLSLMKKIHPGELDYISDFSMIFILSFVFEV